MRLLFTGRAVRASRQTFISQIRPIIRKNSTKAAPLQELGPSPNVLIRKVDQGYAKRTLQTEDIAPEAHDAVKVQQDPFQIFLAEQREPNKIITKGPDSGVVICSRPHTLDATSNLSPSILPLLDRRLYTLPDHPLAITRRLIQSVFPQPTYQHYVATDPVVSTKSNFDVLGFPADHPGRSATDTYYVNKDTVLRTHTSAHQHAAFQAMQDPRAAYGYTICADVFRRDSIDRSHFPVFHQMEGARLWRLPRTNSNGVTISEFEGSKLRKELIKQDLKELGRPPVKTQDPNAAFHDQRNPKQASHWHEEVRLITAHLKRSLEHLVAKVFAAAAQAGHGPEDQQPLKVRWVEAYFPFTAPSWELEVFWQGQWLELLGCGIVQQWLLDKAGLQQRIGWAWGLGLERLAMILFAIPDIRLFWSHDPRFLRQFQADTIARFVPFSKHPACYKDVAFWVPANAAAGESTTAATKQKDTNNDDNNNKPIESPSPSPSPTPGLAAPAGGDTTKAAASASSSSSSSSSSVPATFHDNDVMEIVRDVAGSLAEDVKLVDQFVHPTTGRQSRCYRINYRSLERTLTNDETNRLHLELGRRLVADLSVELR